MKMKWMILVLCALSAAGELTQGTLGKAAKIECGTDSSGKIVEWKRNGGMVYSRDSRTGATRKGNLPVSDRSSLRRGDLLEIINLQEGDAGPYNCEVGDKRHEHILFIMSVSASPPGVLQLDSEAKLTCRVLGLQSMHTVEWVRPGGEPGGSGEVHLNPVARTDEGSWVCKFSQDGKTYYEETLKVKVQGPVTTPVTEGVTERVAAPPASTPSKTNCSDCTHRVVSVVATEPQSGPILLGGLSLWIWVAAGVGCFVLLLLVGCVIALHQRKKRRRRRAWKRTSQQPLKPKQYCQCDRSTGAVDTMAPPPRGHGEKPSTRPPRQHP